MIQVRRTTLDDAGAVADLMCSLGYPTSAQQMAARLEATSRHADYVSLLAVNGSRSVGFLALAFGLFYERDGTYARIVALSVASDSQRCGVGAALVAEAERIARERGAIMCLVNSGLPRAGAHSFYEGRGYAHKGKAFYKTLA
jgi:GNAT superfamily N-acetyltransferase